MRNIFAFAGFILLSLFCVGCGAYVPRETQYGAAALNVSWPREADGKFLIPLPTKSIAVTVSANDGAVLIAVLKRGETQTIELIPAGRTAFYAEAYASEDASGTAIERTPTVYADVKPYPAEPTPVALEFHGAILQGRVVDGIVKCPQEIASTGCETTSSTPGSTSTTCAFTVCDVEATATPIPNASVSIRTTKASVTADAHGFYSARVPLGTLIVLVEAPGYVSRGFSVPVNATITNMDFALPKP